MSRHAATIGELQFAGALAVELKAGRARRGWSQEALARDAGVSSANVRRIESGSSPAASFLMVGRLARSLGVSMDALFAHFPREPT